MCGNHTTVQGLLHHTLGQCQFCQVKIVHQPAGCCSSSKRGKVDWMHDTRRSLNAPLSPRANADEIDSSSGQLLPFPYPAEDVLATVGLQLNSPNVRMFSVTELVKLCSEAVSTIWGVKLQSCATIIQTSSENYPQNALPPLRKHTKE